MKQLIILVVMLGLVGCKEESVDEVAEPSLVDDDGGNPPPPQPTPVTIKVFSSPSADCFKVGAQVWCRGSSAFLNVNSNQFVLFAEHELVIDELNMLTESVCYTAQVDYRPVSQNPGSATYCVGRVDFEDFSGQVQGLSQGQMVPGAQNMVWSRSPVTAFEGESFAQAMGNNHLHIDGDAGVSSQDLQCEVLDGILDCGSFVVDLN